MATLTREQFMALPKEQQLKLSGQDDHADESTLDQVKRISGSLAVGGVHGLTAGLSEPAYAGLSAVANVAKENISGEAEGELLGQLAKKYREGLASYEEVKDAVPMAATIGNVAGMVAPMGVGAKLFRGAIGAAESIPALAKLGQGLGGRVARGTVAAGIGGAEQSAVESVANVASGKDAHNVGADAAVSAGIGAAFPIAGATIKAGLKPMGGVGKFMLAKLAQTPGVDAKFVDEFLNDSKSIAGAKTVEEFIKPMERAVNKARRIGQDAEETLAASAYQSVQGLRNELSELSAESYKLLPNSGKSVSLKGVSDVIRKKLNRLKINGKELDVGEFSKFNSQLLDVADSIDNLPVNISGKNAKKILQQLDGAAKWANDANQSTSIYDDAIKSVRDEIDDRLKVNYKDYKTFMDTKLAPKTRYFDDIKYYFGSPDKASANIKKMSSAVKGGDFPEQIDRKDLIQISSNPNTQGNLTVDPEMEGKLSRLLSEAPGPKTIGKGENLREIPGNPFQPPKPKQFINSNGEWEYPPTAPTAESATGDFLQDLQFIRNLDDWRGNTNIRDKLNGLVTTFSKGSEMNNTLKLQVERLGSYSDTDFESLIAQASKRQTFESIKDSAESLFSQGMYYGVGGGVAAIATGLPPIWVATLAAATRSFGPKAAKSMMIGLANLNGVPTAKKIMSLAIPQELKIALVNGLSAALTTDESDPKEKIDVQSLPAGMEIQKHLMKEPDPIKRAQNLTQLHKDKTVDREHVMNYVIDYKTPTEQVSNPLSKYVDTMLMGGSQPQAGREPQSTSSITDKIRSAAKKYEIPENLLLGLAQQESQTKHLDRSGNVLASNAGAYGVLQVKPATGAELGFDVMDEDQNILAGAAYLKKMFDKYGDWEKALKAYNIGPGNMDRGKLSDAANRYSSAVSLKSQRYLD